MRTNIILMLAFLIFLVGFFSTQVTLTGQASRDQFFTSLSNKELKEMGDYTLDDCGQVARIAGYDKQSHRLQRETVRGAAPIITSTQEYQRNFYADYDLTGDGKIDARDIQLCYDSVRETGDFVRSPIARLRSATAPPACEEGRSQCSRGKLYLCTKDQKGILSWAEIARPNEGQKCHGNRIIEYVTKKQPLGISFLFTAPPP